MEGESENQPHQELNLFELTTNIREKLFNAKQSNIELDPNKPTSIARSEHLAEPDSIENLLNLVNNFTSLIMSRKGTLESEDIDTGELKYTYRNEERGIECHIAIPDTRPESQPTDLTTEEIHLTYTGINNELLDLKIFSPQITELPPNDTLSDEDFEDYFGDSSEFELRLRIPHPGSTSEETLPYYTGIITPDRLTNEEIKIIDNALMYSIES